MDNAGPFDTAGERPLLVFISSVMEPQMEDARASAVEALRNFPQVATWAFEYTPAVSRDPIQTYLQKVQDADFVVWLAAGRTTPAVEAEIRTALKHDRHLLVYLLPAEERDEQTRALLKTVGQRVKWKEVRNASHLKEAVAASLRDEFVRALRGESGRPRLAVLESLARASTARCVQRWQASGIKRAVALEWARDQLRGKPDEACVPSADQPLKVITSGLGGGKSLAAERLLQDAILKARDDLGAPMPVFFSAADVGGSLRTAVMDRLAAHAHPSEIGVFLVIDGLDQLGVSSAFRVINECRSLVTEIPNTVSVLTSRPLPGFALLEEKVALPVLKDDDVLALAHEASGQPQQRNLWGLPEPVRKVVHYPLFAILLGLYWAERSFASPASPGQLIEFLARHVTPTDSTEGKLRTRLLQKAAKLAIERDGVVSVRDIGSEEDVESLLRTPVVAIDEGWLNFNLPVLMHWFAAQSLAQGDPSIDDLIRAPSRLDEWRHALVVFSATQGTREVNALLQTLAENEPGFAAMVVNEAIAERDMSGQGSLPPTEECGNLLRTAMQGWLRGLESLEEYLGPVNDEGHLCTLGIRRTERHLVVSWHTQQTEPEVVELPPVEAPEDLFSRGWGSISSFAPTKQAGWAWGWSLSHLQRGLERLLARRFLCETSDLADAELFEQAALLIGQRSLEGGPISVNHIAGILEQLEDSDLVKVGREVFDPSLLHVRVRECKKQGVDYLIPPWPEPDEERLKTGHLSSLYSDEQLRKRVEAALRIALSGYTEMAEKLFPRLKRRLVTFAVLPAVLEGRLHWVEGHLDYEIPILSWHLRPLPGGENRVEIEWASSHEDESEYGAFMGRERAEKLEAEYSRLRPQARHWLFPYSESTRLDVFSYADINTIAYRWLWNDLNKLHWVSRSIPPWH